MRCSCLDRNEYEVVQNTTLDFVHDSVTRPWVPVLSIIDLLDGFSLLPASRISGANNNYRRFRRNQGQARDVCCEAIAPFAKGGILFVFQICLILCLPLGIYLLFPGKVDFCPLPVFYMLCDKGLAPRQILLRRRQAHKV